MTGLLRALAAASTRRPALVLLISVLLVAALGAMAPQAQQDDQVSVDNEVSRASETISDRFADGGAPLQVVIEADDALSPQALQAVTAVRQAVQSSPAADALVAGDQPPIVSYLDGVATAVEQQGIDPASLDAERIRTLREQAAEQLPDELAARTDALLADGEPPTVGLMLLFVAEGDTDEETSAAQRELAAAVEGAEVPDGVTATPFSFSLLLEGSDIGGEVGRLFGTALAIILLILAVVYRVPAGAGWRGAIARRTAADVGLTLLVILLAVVAMQGAGVLLGPGYLGLIGAFSPQTQIVPVLVVGLGVDFAIHLLARYRSELADGASPEAGLTTSLSTIGVTLLLCAAATAIGFMTNLSSPVEFLATLGVLAAVGVLAAFLLTCTVIPAARTLLDRRAEARDRLPRHLLGAGDRGVLAGVSRVTWLAERAAVPTLVVALLVGAAGAYGFTQLDSRFSLTDFVPRDEPLLDTFETIQAELGGTVDETTDVLLDGELATADAHAALRESLQAAAEIDDVTALEGRVDGTTPLSVLAAGLADEDLGPRLREAGAADDLSIEGGDDAVAEVYRLLLGEADNGDVALAEADGELIGRARLRTTAGQEGAGALADDLEGAFAPLEEVGVEAVPTSQRILQDGIGDDIEDAQLTSLAVALGAAMLLLALAFARTDRRPLLGVLTVLPVGLVLALTFGTMAATGVPLNPVTATLAALSIGIGVPFMIHVTARFLEERARADDAAALRRTLATTGGALAGSAATTAIGFGVLITSTLLPFEQLGYVIVYAIAWSLLAAVLVLPSILLLWARRHP